MRRDGDYDDDEFWVPTFLRDKAIAAQTNGRQILAQEHHAGGHLRRQAGCGFCYPPGPDGKHIGTKWRDLGVESLVG